MLIDTATVTGAEYVPSTAEAVGSRWRTFALVMLLAVATGAIYFWRLQDMPTYITRDEVFVGLTGHALATSGRDTTGEFMPIVFYHRGTASWWSPILLYLTAGVLKVLPFSEFTVRIPMAIAAIVNVLLVFFISRIVLRRASLAWIPAMLLAITPAHIMENRFADDEGLPMTFVLASMLAMVIYLRDRKPRALFLSGLLLSLGSFSYVGAAPLMPIYVAFTIGVLLLRREPWQRVLTFAAGSLIPVAIAVIWVAGHPDAIRTTLMHYQSDDAQTLPTSTVVTAFASWRHALEVARLYLDFWNVPALFIVGGPWDAHTTGRSGVLLIAMAGLLAIGIVRAARDGASNTYGWLWLGGFFLAPIPSSFFPDFNDHLARHATWRAMPLFPFAALLAGLGLDYVLSHERARSRIWQVAVAASVAIPAALFLGYRNTLPKVPLLLSVLLVPLAAAAVAIAWKRVPPARAFAVAAAVALGAASLAQFQDFYADYLGDYRLRFIPQTDGNVRDVFEAVIDRSPAVAPSQLRTAPAVYLGFRMGVGNWGHLYWQFYLHKHQREDLLARTINDINASRFSRDLVCSLPPESIVATRFRVDRAADALVDRMSKQGDVIVEARTRSDAPYWVLRTTGTCATE